MATLTELREIVRRVAASERSDFYTDRLRDVDIQSWDDWSQLPLLTKADIQRVPFEDRIFVDPSEVAIVRLTSGTTSSDVLAIPRVQMPHTDHERTIMPVRSFMGFLLPHLVHDNHAAPTTKFIGGDPARLTASAYLAARMEIEGLDGLPSTLIAFAGPLAAVYDTRRITHLSLVGERCTKMQREALERLYPSVRSISIVYASSELQGLCAISDASNTNHNVLRGNPHVHYELIDEAGAPVTDLDTPGELVVTTLYSEAAFPLIRYRTGDTARIISRDKRTLFTVEGRTNGDRIRFDAGAIVLAELERAIARVGKGYVSDFEAIVSEEEHNGRPMIKLSITLIIAEHYAPMLGPDIGKALEKELRVNERRTYADAMERGACAAISCTIADLDYGRGRKRRRLRDERDA